MSEAGQEGSGSTVNGRYHLLAHLGAGGTGDVYRARDGITGEIIAVKLLNPHTTSAGLRHRREVLVLRALQLPGVVRLIDEGRSDGRPFIAMEYVDGEPFPGGGRRTWREIAAPTMSLLETLARVHAAGVIHRDLKPANVLVDAAGRPVLLDFGLARGDKLGDAVTRPDAVVGTPRYQAPEQLAGQPLDARTDLYALGVLLYEVLAGRPPHPLDSIGALASARLYKDAPPLQYAAPDVPAEVCRVVDRLLARLPEARPGSANEVIEALRGLSADGDRAPLPWLGGDEAVRAALDALHATRTFEVIGARGSGRTRFLQEIAAALGRQGRRAAWTSRGGRPFESLAPIVGTPDTLEALPDGTAPPPPDPSTIARTLLARLRETLAGGTVVLVDDAEDLDPWTADLLEAVCPDAAVVRAWRSPPAVAGGAPWTLRPLAEADLRALFHGPDRLLHLREDGARALFERTAGNPARVVAEVAAWVGGGFASWRDGLLALDRTALDRLDGGVALHVPAFHAGAPLKRGLERILAWVTLAWPRSTTGTLHAVCGGSPWEVDMMLGELERLGAVRRTSDGRYEPCVAAVSLQEWAPEERRRAHAALAALAPEGGNGRFAHLVAAEDFAAAAREAHLVAEKLVTDGYVGRAMGVLSQGLEAAREAGDTAIEEALLTDAALGAMAENLPSAIEYVRYEIGRAAPSEGLARLERLLVGVLALVRGDGATEAEVYRGLAPFSEMPLECWRRALRQDVAFRAGSAVSASVLDEQIAWADASGSALARGRAYGWMGLHRYREGRMAEAAEWHLRALPLKEGAADRLSTLLNAASALMEAQDLEEALRWASDAEAFAAEHRLVPFEARAAWIRRSVEYRLAKAIEPDLELVEAAGLLGSPRIEALVLASEAAAAWRAGHQAAAGLARRCERAYARSGNIGARVVLAALALQAEGSGSPEAWRAVVSDARQLSPGVPLAQVLGLVALAGVVWEPEWTELAERSLAVCVGENPDVRRAVLADTEIAAYLRIAHARLR